MNNEEMKKSLETLFLIMKKTRAKKFKVRIYKICSGGFLSGGVLAWGFFVGGGGVCRGVYVRGVFVLIPSKRAFYTPESISQRNAAYTLYT